MFDSLYIVHPHRIHLVWGALAFVLVLAWFELHGRGVLSKYILPGMQRRLARQLSTPARIVRLVLILFGLTLVVLSLMRPQTREREAVETKVASADLMVVLDVSRSMLATDAAPTRLDRAKAELRDMLPTLEGTRVGLIAFAGRAAVVSPLTPDHGYFRVVLDATSPKSVSRGGTRIGDALRKAVDALQRGDEEKGPAAARAIILVTDGEDHESYPVEAAEAAADAGIPIIAIGFGDESGTTIELEDPETGGTKLLRDNDGNVVRTRLDGETLRTIASTTEGVYVPAGTAVLDLESIVESHITPLIAQKQRTITREKRTELYPWLLASAMLFLTASSLVGIVGLTAPGRTASSEGPAREATSTT